ncbi:protein phosphatase CheZ [Aliikangiella maris]|uniref:Protein phosphatase CheZ n=2 Tax=Aliikangiella maris TaxID=3162458 RepID=A0ABV2BSB4_9GAMM
MNLSDKEQLEKAISNTRELLAYMEADQIDDAQKLFDSLTRDSDEDLFREIGKLTRHLHEALSNFQLDSRITDLAASEIPDAKDRLNYVIEKTEEAANKTMDKVEQCHQMADLIAKDSQELLVEWQKLYRRELEPGDFRKLCKRIESHLVKNKDSSNELQAELSEVLLAQDYQDLTGQVIRQVITLVHNVEESMVNVIKMFGNMEGYSKAKVQPRVVEGVEGPITNKEKRSDVVSGQDEVDDLLSSLGF